MDSEEYVKIQSNMLMEIKVINTTIKGVKNTEMYKEIQIYNAAIRKCMDIVKKEYEGS